MEEFIHELRWKVDDVEWRARARRELTLGLWKKYAPDYQEKGQAILDIGCGTGALLTQFNPIATAYGLDLSPTAARRSRQRGLDRIVVGDAEAPCYRSRSFDLVTMIEVLEHVEDDLGALNRLKLLLKPEGLLILTVPAFDSLWSDRDAKLQHKRRYTKSVLMGKIQSAGMSLVFCSYIDFFLFLPLCCIVAVDRILANSFKHHRYEVSFPGLINHLFLTICRLERMLYPTINFPLGVSLVCVAKNILADVSEKPKKQF